MEKKLYKITFPYLPEKKGDVFPGYKFATWKNNSLLLMGYCKNGKFNDYKSRVKNITIPIIIKCIIESKQRIGYNYKYELLELLLRGEIITKNTEYIFNTTNIINKTNNSTALIIYKK